LHGAVHETDKLPVIVLEKTATAITIRSYTRAQETKVVLAALYRRVVRVEGRIK